MYMYKHLQSFSFTHFFFFVVYDDQIWSSLQTVLPALSPALPFRRNIVKIGLIVNPFIYKHNQFNYYHFIHMITVYILFLMLKGSIFVSFMITHFMKTFPQFSCVVCVFCMDMNTQQHQTHCSCSEASDLLITSWR